MMLKYSCNMDEAAAKIERAVENVLNQGHRTGDIAGEGEKAVGTKEMGELIIGDLRKQYE